jgi:hypothetical protein
MFCACKTVSLIAFVALLSAGPAFTQTPSPDAAPDAKAPAPVAYVYVQTHLGVNAYTANATGELTSIKGSPFADTGQAEASNGKYLFSFGTDYIHLYKIESNGAVGKQASEINTQDYGPAHCGYLNYGGSVLDHTGKFLYVQLFTYASCGAWQSYRVESNGKLTFLGQTTDLDGSAGLVTSVPTISGNDNFGYSRAPQTGNLPPQFIPFTRTQSGELENSANFTVTGPTIPPGPLGSDFYPLSVAADPTGHLAVAGTEGNDGPIVLASFTIDNVTGAIESTNTSADMPYPNSDALSLSMSPSGDLLAVATDALQIFHFNGAAPITPYSAVLIPGVAFAQLAWDNNNHLYALSNASEELYVWTVTATSITEVSGSPYSVPNAYGVNNLIVVPKL